MCTRTSVRRRPGGQLTETPEDRLGQAISCLVFAALRHRGQRAFIDEGVTGDLPGRGPERLPDVTTGRDNDHACPGPDAGAACPFAGTQRITPRAGHVSLEVECVDRLYLPAYRPPSGRAGRWPLVAMGNSSGAAAANGSPHGGCRTAPPLLAIDGQSLTPRRAERAAILA